MYNRGMGQPQPQRFGGRRNNRNFNRNSRFDNDYGNQNWNNRPNDMRQGGGRNMPQQQQQQPQQQPPKPANQNNSAPPQNQQNQPKPQQQQAPNTPKPLMQPNQPKPQQPVNTPKPQQPQNQPKPQQSPQANTPKPQAQQQNQPKPLQNQQQTQPKPLQNQQQNQPKPLQQQQQNQPKPPQQQPQNQPKPQQQPQNQPKPQQQQQNQPKPQQPQQQNQPKPQQQQNQPKPQQQNQPKPPQNQQGPKPQDKPNNIPTLCPVNVRTTNVQQNNQAQNQQMRQNNGPPKNQQNNNMMNSMQPYQNNQHYQQNNGNHQNNQFNDDQNNFGNKGDNQQGRGGRLSGIGNRRGDRGGNREEHFIFSKLKEISGPMMDLAPLDLTEQKFSGRNRLYIGNLTNDTTEQELQEMFGPYGETSELFINKEKNFAFIRFDYKANAEKAKRDMDGKMRRGRPLRVRLAPHNAAIRVKNLTPHVTNELLFKAFEVFGKVERAIVRVDERGKTTSEGIVEFFRRVSAQSAIRFCSERCFFLTASLRPVIVEIFEETDEGDGYTEKSISKRGPDYQRSREMGPRFAEAGSFEHEYGTRWKQLYELFKQKEDALKRELVVEEEKLEAQMEYAKYEHETELLREQLRQRELDREKQKRSWEMAERQAEEIRERERENLLRQEEEMTTRMRLQEDELMRRQQENTLFMKAQQLNRLLDEQEQGMEGGGGRMGRGGYDMQQDNRGNMQMDVAYGMDNYNSGGVDRMGYDTYDDGMGRWDNRQGDYPNKRRRY